MREEQLHTCNCSFFVSLGEIMAKLTFGRQKRRINYDMLRHIITWTVEILSVCGIAFVLVWYFGLRVSMIGDSMKPELNNGDVTLVNRLVYDMSQPKRGDVIAFKPKGNEATHHYIKRVVGLLGETLEVRDGKLLVDGKEIKEKYEATKIEELGILEEPVTLGENEYFVLGDDRKNSEDSRHEEVGNVSRAEIIGKVWFIVSGEDFGFVR